MGSKTWIIKDEYQFASVEEQAEFIRIVQNAINNNSKNFLARLKEVAKEVREECEKEWPADGQHLVVFLGHWPTGTGRPALTGAYDLSCVYHKKISMHLHLLGSCVDYVYAARI